MASSDFDAKATLDSLNNMVSGVTDAGKQLGYWFNGFFGNPNYFSNGYQASKINGKSLSKTGVTVSDTGMAGTKNIAGKDIDSQNVWTTGDGNYYVWIGDGKGFGFYVQLDKDMFNNKSRNQYDFTNYKDTNLANIETNGVVNYKDIQANTKKTETSKTNGAGTASAPATPKSDDSKYLKQIDELTKQVAELTKVYSAEELAERYGIDLSEQNRLNDYNNQTNEYFDNMINEQSQLRDDTLRNNSYYDQRLLQEFNNSYQNTVNSQTGDAARAATALSMMNTNAYNTSYNDYQLMQSLNNLEEAKKKELAENVFKAKDDTTSLKTYLSGLSATHNASDVQNYVNELNNLGLKYAASRATAAANADAINTRYAGLANASSSYANSTAGYQEDLYNFFLQRYNGNTKQAASAVVNQMSTGAGGTGLSTRYAK